VKGKEEGREGKGREGEGRRREGDGMRICLLF